MVVDMQAPSAPCSSANVRTCLSRSPRGSVLRGADGQPAFTRDDVSEWVQATLGNGSDLLRHGD